MGILRVGVIRNSNSRIKINTVCIGILGVGVNRNRNCRSRSQ